MLEKIEEWKEIAILKLLFPSTFILILEIAIYFHFDCYFLPLYRIAISFQSGQSPVDFMSVLIDYTCNLFSKLHDKNWLK